MTEVAARQPGAAVLEGLNPAQREAVAAPPGPTLVFAGAGSGKTRVLTRRIAWRVLAGGADPGAVLAVTFTNKAAREMRDRVGRFGGEEFERVWTSTFHAFGLRLLRRFGSDGGLRRFGEEAALPAGFAVLGSDDSQRILRRIGEEMLDDPDLKPAQVARQVSQVRVAEALGQPVVAATDSHYWKARMRHFGEVARRYAEELTRQRAVDFDDLILLCCQLLERPGPAREFVERRVRHLLVDEYQDTSPVQHHLIRLLASHRDVFVVGDDDQAIYSFRGADHRNLRRFREDFPGARTFRLEENYRSTAKILDAANALIRENATRVQKTLRATGSLGAPVRFFRYGGEAEEARGVAERLLETGTGRGSCAVLYRTRAQSRAFEEAFTGRRLPHLVVGGLRFYERKEVQDAVAQVRLAVRPEDDDAFRRALGARPRGVGSTSLGQIEEVAGKEGRSLRDAAREMLDRGRFAPRIAAGLDRFLEDLRTVAAAAEAGPGAAVDASLDETGLLAQHLDDEERTKNLESLRRAGRQFEQQNPDDGAAEFLDQVALLSAEDFLPESDGNGTPPVLLMTVHAAKGLEFDTVFLCGLWEGLFPHHFSLRRDTAVEEERRLFYVGMTRARKSLTLTAAPAGWGSGGGVSRFVGEIPRELFERGAVAAAAPRVGDAAPARGEFERGDRVRHRRFGNGRVESVDPDGARLSVLFPNHGRKRLVVRYAGLTRVTAR